jgi:catechol 2,3-dioxygenase
MALQKLTYAHLRVTNIDACIEFHQSVMGLTLLERAADRALFSAGADDEVDLILTEESGRAGAAGFALSADSAEDLDVRARKLKTAGVSWLTASDPLPGISRTLSFDLPSGHHIALALLAKPPAYLHPSRGPRPRDRGCALLDVDHITLRIDNGVRRTMDFLREVVGLRSSDIQMLPDGEPMATWMRIGEYHHDVAMFAGHLGESLDHLAWTAAGIEDIKRMLDLLARHDIKAEAGPGRHGIGGNLYAYFRAPGGNRYELSGEMPRVPHHLAEPVIWTDLAAGFSAWGATHPESFKWGS